MLFIRQSNFFIMALTLENVISPSLFSVKGDVGFTEGASTGGFPEGPNPQVVQRDQPVTFSFDWDQKGPLVPFLFGNWKCDIYFESLTAGPGYVFNKSITFVSSVPFVYPTTNIVVPANTIEEGIYRLTARLMLTNTGSPGSPIAAFQDLGLCEFYVG